MYTTGPTVAELIADAVELTTVGEYSVEAQETQVVVDCAGTPDGDATEDCNGVCNGGGETCTINGIWQMESFSLYQNYTCTGSALFTMNHGIYR